MASNLVAYGPPTAGMEEAIARLHIGSGAGSTVREPTASVFNQASVSSHSFQVIEPQVHPGWENVGPGRWQPVGNSDQGSCELEAALVQASEARGVGRGSLQLVEATLCFCGILFCLCMLGG